MKNDYPELNFDMEHLLQTKKYEELTPEELSEISDFISSKEDYVLMQNTFLSVKSSFGAEEEILPADDTKSKLMQAFESKHGKVVSINKPRPFYLNPLFQVGVAAVFIIGIIFFYPAGKNDDNMTAMNHADENKNENVATEEEGKELKDAEEATEESADEMPMEEAEKEAALESNVELLDGLSQPGYKTLEEKPKGSGDRAEKANDVAVTGNVTTTVTSKNVQESEMDVFFSRTDNTKAEKTSKDVSDDRNQATSGGLATFGTPSVDMTTVSDESLAETTTVTESKKSVAKKDKAEEKAKEKRDGDVRTNSIGGRYYQPASAMDVKVGVSLKDKPDLSTFLFTAL